MNAHPFSIIFRWASLLTGVMLTTTLLAVAPKNADYQRYALQHAGNPSRGKRLFHDQRTQCIVCHKVGGKGGDVGKDLSSIGGKFGRPHLIESLLEPSRQIVEGYHTTQVLTADGSLVSGIVKSQTPAQLTLVDARGKSHTIQRTNIDEQTESSVSLMPQGLAQELSLSEFSDLIAYLETLGKGSPKRGGHVRGAISLPDGFSVDVVATGMDGVTALQVLPDGRVLVCEQPGCVRVIDKGRLLEEPFVTLPVDAYWERGVIGVTHDPEFPKKPFVYVCWVAKKPYPHHRVSRFTMRGNVAIPGSEKVLLVGDDQTKMGGHVPAGHQGGALHFGPDGKLYIAIGEQTSGVPSQSLDTFLGKILRINSDGTLPRDNPLVSKTKGKYQAIWAYGCRNPFTFAFRKSDGLMLINDVGGESEEINVGRAGANYGWPIVDHGNQAQYKDAKFDGPIHWYPSSSLNGGDFCPKDSRWPKTWRNKFFFADFQHGWIKTIDPKDAKNATKFLSGIRQPVDLEFAPDGSLYVLLRGAWVIDDKFGGGTGSLLRIRSDANGMAPAVASPSAIQPNPLQSSPLQSSPLQSNRANGTVTLVRDAKDSSAGGLPAFKIQTDRATYFLEKTGGGLSSLIDRDGKDWLGFNPQPGSKASGEYRGFPNAVHHQRGSYFHAKNAHCDPMKTEVEKVDSHYVSIKVESKTGHWAGRYEFFPTHCTFTMIRVPKDSQYWVLYEGVPGGQLNLSDWWMTSAIKSPQPISRKHEKDIPSPEWMAFGDAGGKRSIVLFHHEDDDYPDTHYQMKNKMTVFGFGRRQLEAFHCRSGQRFSIGLVESTSHDAIADFIPTMAVHP